jgi:hypothetical protein
MRVLQKTGAEEVAERVVLFVESENRGRWNA